MAGAGPGPRFARSAAKRGAAQTSRGDRAATATQAGVRSPYGGVNLPARDGGSRCPPRPTPPLPHRLHRARAAARSRAPTATPAPAAVAFGREIRREKGAAPPSPDPEGGRGHAPAGPGQRPGPGKPVLQGDCAKPRWSRTVVRSEAERVAGRVQADAPTRILSGQGVHTRGYGAGSVTGSTREGGFRARLVRARLRGRRERVPSTRVQAAGEAWLRSARRPRSRVRRQAAGA